MASTRAVWGIDIGQCALKALRVRAVGDKFEVLDHEYIEHEKILSWQEADRASLINKAMEQFLSKRDVRQDYVVVGVPGTQTLTRFPKLPPVETKKIPEIVRYEAEQQIPFDMDEVVWDWQAFSNPETKETEVGVFAMRREFVAEHMRPFAAAGLEPIVVQSNPLALYAALRYDGLLGEGITLAIDIGTQNTDLIIADKYTLWTRNLPLGGNSFTNTLAAAFKLPLPRAEALKRTASTSKYARQIFQNMRPVFADLVGEIQRTMGFYSSTHRGARVTRIVAMGSAFKLPGLQKFLQSNLNIEVVRPTTFNKLATASTDNAARLVEHLMGFGVCYGLAVQGLGRGEITSNLLPPEIARGIVWRKKTPWFWGAAACLTLAASLVWGRYFWDSRALAAAGVNGNLAPSPVPEPEAKRLLASGVDSSGAPLEYAARVAGLATSLDRIYNEYKSKGTEEENKSKQIADLQKDKLLWPRILQEIHNALPRPQAKLAEAMDKGPEALAEAIKNNQVPARTDREQIFITSLSVAYADDTNALFPKLRSALPMGLAAEAAPAAAAPSDAGGQPPPTGPGYVVRLTGTTPHKNGTRFIEDKLLKRLASVSPQTNTKRGFVFVVDPAKAIVTCEAVAKKGSLPAASPSGGGGGGLEPGMGAGGFGGVSGGMGSRTIDTRIGGETDPVTGEATGSDWAFEIMFQIVIAAPQPAEGSQPK